MRSLLPLRIAGCLLLLFPNYGYRAASDIPPAGGVALCSEGPISSSSPLSTRRRYPCLPRFISTSLSQGSDDARRLETTTCASANRRRRGNQPDLDMYKDSLSDAKDVGAPGRRRKWSVCVYHNQPTRARQVTRPSLSSSMQPCITKAQSR